MNLSIIIVNYNVEKYIISCIQSIYKHSRSNYKFEIIVIDNNSSDNSVKKIKKKYPNVKLIENSENYGYSIAANQGGLASKGEYLFFLNPDTFLIEDSLSVLIEKAKNIKEKFILGPVLATTKGSIHQSFWGETNLINTIFSIYHLDFLNVTKNYTFKKKSELEVNSVSGGAFFLAKKTFEDFQGFDENLFWMEDIDFCKRVKDQGHKILYTQITRIIHYVGKSSLTNYKITVSNQLISKIKYFKKHYSALSKNIIIINILIICTIKTVIFIIFSPFSVKYRKKLLAYFYTINKIIFKKF